VHQIWGGGRKTVIGAWYWLLASREERVMMAEKFTQPPMRRTGFVTTLARLVGQPRFDRLRGMPLLSRFAGRNAIEGPDPILLAVLVIDRVGPAAVRACASGVEVCVTAPDEPTARILRAALVPNGPAARHRSTNSDRCRLTTRLALPSDCTASSRGRPRN
jgi:antitoxin (DNA-binding transcriptional repressor) of toxin-antitoxin stability system